MMIRHGLHSEPRAANCEDRPPGMRSLTRGVKVLDGTTVEEHAVLLVEPAAKSRGCNKCRSRTVRVPPECSNVRILTNSATARKDPDK
jgi:hypothetical protein